MGATVDEILATGRYTDRRGRKWSRARDGWTDFDLLTRTITFLRPKDMRLLVARDFHRSECPGLIDCEDHPVPCVTLAGGPYGCFHVNPADDSEETYVAHECSHERAMDAARALAVGE